MVGRTDGRERSRKVEQAPVRIAPVPVTFSQSRWQLRRSSATERRQVLQAPNCRNQQRQAGVDLRLCGLASQAESDGPEPFALDTHRL